VPTTARGGLPLRLTCTVGPFCWLAATSLESQRTSFCRNLIDIADRRFDQHQRAILAKKEKQ
jgi:hypothetical protein